MKGGVRQSTSIGVDYHYGKIGVEPVELTGRWGGGVGRHSPGPNPGTGINKTGMSSDRWLEIRHKAGALAKCDYDS